MRELVADQVRNKFTRSGETQAVDISRIENGRLDARWSNIHRSSSALESFTGKPRRSLATGYLNHDSVNVLAPTPKSDQRMQRT